MEHAGLEGFCCGFGRVALGFGHGFGVSDDHAGGATKDFADGPGAVFVGDEDFADALLLGAVVPAAQQGEVVAQKGEIVAACLLFLRVFSKRGLRDLLVNWWGCRLRGWVRAGWLAASAAGRRGNCRQRFVP